MNGLARTTCSVVLTAMQICAAEVVFARRVYQEHGRSYYQLWQWETDTGEIRQLTHSGRDHFAPFCKSAGRLEFISPEPWQDTAKTWVFNRTTGVERVIAQHVPKAKEPEPGQECAAMAKSGSLRACATGGSVTLTDAGRVPARVKVGGAETRILGLRWSTDRKWLLVEKIGRETNSTSPRSDYFIVDAAGRETIFAGSGNGAGWIPGRAAIFYSTPRDTALLPWAPKHEEWVANIVRFNVATRKTDTVTSGLASNIDPQVCR